MVLREWGVRVRMARDFKNVETSFDLFSRVSSSLGNLQNENKRVKPSARVDSARRCLLQTPQTNGCGLRPAATELCLS